MLTVTPIYAGLAAFMLVALSVRVIRGRGVARVGLGDGDNLTLRRAMRAHGNFVEYVPLVLLLMALAEFQAAAAWQVHLVGVLLLVGRLAHALGVSREPEPRNFRVVGMALTFAALITGGLMNLGLPGLTLLFAGG